MRGELLKLGHAVAATTIRSVPLGGTHPALRSPSSGVNHTGRRPRAALNLGADGPHGRQPGRVGLGRSCHGHHEMCATLLRRRERLGISYLMVGDELMEAFAPVVERLTGK